MRRTGGRLVLPGWAILARTFRRRRSTIKVVAPATRIVGVADRFTVASLPVHVVTITVVQPIGGPAFSITLAQAIHGHFVALGKVSIRWTFA